MASIFKQNILGPIPADAQLSNSGAKRFATWSEDGRRVRREVVTTTKGDKAVMGQTSAYYGKIKVGSKWQRVKLFTDKTASARKLAEMQRNVEWRAAGVVTAWMEKTKLPIADLAQQYIDAMKAQGLDAEHVRISKWMLDKLLELGGWGFFGDITSESMQKILATLEQQGKTVSYRNKFIVRAKAFTAWVLPSDVPNPLADLRRIKEKGAKRTRGRRAATAAELKALFDVKIIPDDRKLAYALAAFNGMRRNEAAGLLWQDLHLDATIPFVGLLQKQGTDDSRDSIPLHPYVLKLLRQRTAAMPGVKVLRSVPDLKTLKKDLQRAGVEFKDDAERRLDYHALRHTFQTSLDMAGCSRATKKKLMRHANEDVTDGYAHAELAEMLAALARLPSPSNWQQAQVVKTGTDDAVLISGTGPNQPDQKPDQTLCAATRGLARPRTQKRGTSGDRGIAQPVDNTGDCALPCTKTHTYAQLCLPEMASGDTVRKTRPSTQAGYEDAANSPENTQAFSESDHIQDQDIPPTAQKHSELTELITAWPSLPDDLQRMILAVVRSTPRRRRRTKIGAKPVSASPEV